MSRTNKDLARSFMVAAGKGDLETLKTLLHPEFRIVEADGLPYAGTRHGAEALVGLVKEVFATWVDCKVKVRQFAAEGEYVFVLADMSGRGRADVEAFQMPIVEVYRFQDGLIIEVRPFYFDTKRLHDAHFGHNRP